MVANTMVRKRYTELVVSIAKGAPQALTLLDIVIGMGKPYITRKGFYLFSERHRVRSIRRVVTASLNEAAQSDRNANKTVAKKRTALLLALFGQNRPMV